MFDVLEIAIRMVASLRSPLATLQVCDRDMHRQVRRAAASVTLNISEGQRRGGKDRRHHWRVAAGSADEVRTALRTAVALGDLREEDLAESYALLDRVLAMLWKLTH